MILTYEDINLIIRLGAATILGGLIGFERELSGKEAGVRAQADLNPDAHPVPDGLGQALPDAPYLFVDDGFQDVVGEAGSAQGHPHQDQDDEEHAEKGGSPHC